MSRLSIPGAGQESEPGPETVTREEKIEAGDCPLWWGWMEDGWGQSTLDRGQGNLVLFGLFDIGVESFQKKGLPKSRSSEMLPSRGPNTLGRLIWADGGGVLDPANSHTRLLFKFGSSRRPPIQGRGYHILGKGKGVPRPPSPPPTRGFVAGGELYLFRGVDGWFSVSWLARSHLYTANVLQATYKNPFVEGVGH